MSSRKQEKEIPTILAITLGTIEIRTRRPHQNAQLAVPDVPVQLVPEEEDDVDEVDIAQPSLLQLADVTVVLSHEESPDPYSFDGDDTDDE